MSKIIASSLLLAAVGCAAAPLPDLGPDHPASPEAAEAPLRPASETLSTAAEAPPASAPHSEPKQPVHGRDHGATKAEEEQGSSPEHGGHDGH